MQLRNNTTRYGAIAQLFHWTVVVLIITQFVLANKAGALPLGPAKIATLAQHKSVGITILALALLRLTWRWLNPVPALPAATPRWQRIAAHFSHWALYALIIITPFVGWMMSSARNFPVSWFGLITLPDFVKPNRPLYDSLHATHEVLATTLFVLALAHITAALKHHFVDGDNVLRRMLPVKLKREGDSPEISK